MQKLVRIALALAVLLAYAAPVEAMLSSAGCCKGHACCRRARGAGWMAGRTACEGACCCAFAAPPAHPAAPREAGIAVALVSSAAAPMPSQARPVSRAPISLYQRPPPTR